LSRQGLKDDRFHVGHEKLKFSRAGLRVRSVSALTPGFHQHARLGCATTKETPLHIFSRVVDDFVENWR
jgi:hypothetical protein